MAVNENEVELSPQEKRKMSEADNNNEINIQLSNIAPSGIILFILLSHSEQPGVSISAGCHEKTNKHPL